MSGRPAVPHNQEVPDVAEHGRAEDGSVTSSTRILYMQLQVFTGCENTDDAVTAFTESGLQGALYAHLNDPTGIGVLTISESPDHFIDAVRPFLTAGPFADMAAVPEMAMFGRTYSIGYEKDLDECLINRPRRTALNPEWPWVVWYPLRRGGAFEQLDAKEQRGVLAEHGTIGRAWGATDLAHDVRLACHGLDINDSDFVIGIIGKELRPLSGVVQRMRKTQQTSIYLERLGPFFIGKAIAYNQ